MPASSLVALLAARASAEALPLALLVVALSGQVGGHVGLQPAWLALAGGLLALAGVALAVERARFRADVAIATLVVALGGAWLTADRGIEFQLLGSRLIFAALLAAVVFWRGFAIPETLDSWREMAVVALLATLGASAASLHPTTRADLPLVAAAAGVLAAVGLSIARGSEELLAQRRRGTLRTRVAAAAALVLGVAAAAVVAFAPQLRRVAEVLAPGVEAFLFALFVLVVTPFAYLAAWIVEALLPILRRLQATEIPLPPFLQQVFGRRLEELDEEYVRRMSEFSQAFLWTLLVIVVSAVLAYLLLRALLARRVLLPAGATLERERVVGMSLRELLRRLTARPPDRPPRPGGDDPAARVRRAYWDLLALADRAGARWRMPHETPREHLGALGSLAGAAELAGASASAGEAARAAAWAPADALVSAFERVRYGERASAAEADAAERALADVRRAVTERA